jgi:hypothetical protein
VVIVEPALGDNGLYITTDELLVEMKTTDAARRLSARLIGGNGEDIYGFVWEVVDFVSLEKLPTGQSRDVVNIVGNADVCMVSSVREGYAIVRVTHPKTNYRLEIRVVVQDVTGINFTQQNIRMDVHASETVAVTSPAGETVIYRAQPADVVRVSGTGKACVIEALKAGTAIVTAQNAGGTKSDEIIVVVSNVTANNAKYIEVKTGTQVSDLYTLRLTQTLSLQADIKKVTDNSSMGATTNGTYIRWEIKTAGVVTMFPAAGTGAQISLTAAGAGETEIWLRGATLSNGVYTYLEGMNNYIKKIYVKVEDEAVNFVVNNGEQYIQLTAGGAPSNFIATVNLPVTYYTANAATGVITKAVTWAIGTAAEQAYLGIEDVGKVGDNRSTCKFTPLARTNNLTNGYVTVTCRYGDMERRLYVQINPMSSVLANPSAVTVLPWELDGQPVGVSISLFPENDTWTASLNTNEYIWAGTTLALAALPGSDNNMRNRAGGSLRGGNNATLYISGKNVEGETDIRITGEQSKITATVKVITSKNFHIRFLDKAMVREDLTGLSNSGNGTGKSYLWNYDIYQDGSTWKKKTPGDVDSTGVALTTDEIDTIKSSWYQVKFDSSNDDVTVIRPTKPDYVNVYVNNTLNSLGYKMMYFGVKKAGGGNVEFESKKGGTTVSMPVYFYYPLIEPQWIEVYANEVTDGDSTVVGKKVSANSIRGKGRGFQAANNGYGTEMGINSYLDMIRGAIVVADGEFIELTVNKDNTNPNPSNYKYEGRDYIKTPANSLNTKFPFNDFRIIPHQASMFTEMCENDFRSKVSVRMGAAWNGENVVQVEFNNGRKVGGAPSDLLLDVNYIGTLKVQYAYSNGGPVPQTFERVFLVYAERYKRP